MTAGARHHHVPQFHLRAWGHGDGRGRIWVYDKTTDAITKRSVKGVAFQPDYYRVRSSTGGTHDLLEGLFSQMESAAAPWLKHLAALSPGRHEIPPTARDTIAGYLAILHARVPAQRDIVRGMGQLFEAAQIDMDLRDPAKFRKRARGVGLPGSDEELERIRTDTLADLESGRLVLEAPTERG